MSETKLQREYSIRSPGNGAYQVKLVGRDVANTASILLTGAEDFATVLLEPGDYTAIIEPIGSSEAMRQSLDLTRDFHGWVQLRDDAFSEGKLRMSAGGGSFWMVGTEAQFKRPAPVPTRTERRARIKHQTPSSERPPADEAVAKVRKFSVGISVRYSADPNRRWRRGTLPVTVSDQPDGGAALILRRRAQWEYTPEWRLTAAIANDRRWRMRVPLFRGGVEVVLNSVQSSAGLDLGVTVAPRRTERAALIANLESMFLGSAREIIRASFPKAARAKNPFKFFLENERDPWICTAAALLLAQADELGDNAGDLRRAAKHCEFIPDMTVLVAWTYAREGREGEVLRQLKAIAGHPYFAVSQEIGIELLTGLTLCGSSAQIRARAEKEWQRWANVKRRQVQTGAFLSWEDLRMSPSFRLDRANYETIAAGSITPGNIIIVPQEAKPRLGQAKVPALMRPVVVEDDTWAGRFGGLKSDGGFKITAEFARGPSTWVEVTILVTAPAGLDPRHVELFLHDSYHPDRVRVPFDGHTACHTALAWGGFTVGAWIERYGIELELNLAHVDAAPAAIREL